MIKNLFALSLGAIALLCYVLVIFQILFIIPALILSYLYFIIAPTNSFPSNSNDDVSSSSKYVYMPSEKKCPRCKGTTICVTCRGTGFFGGYTVYTPERAIGVCPDCNGSRVCNYCGGSGK